MAADGLHIALSAEPIALIGDFVITNSMFTNVVVSALLIGFAYTVNRSLKQTDRPSGLQNVAEGIVEALYNFVHSVTNDNRKSRLFLPLISTFFLVILLNNWLGLIPGVGTIVVHNPVEAREKEKEEVIADITEISETPEGEEIIEHIETIKYTESAEHGEKKSHPAVPLFRPGTADLNTTLAFGMISIIAVQLFGFHFQKFAYFGKYLNFSSPVMFFVGILEMISEFAKIISFGFRLFGNIFAGEVLLVVLTYLTGVIAPMPFYGLEIFIGFIQALVFAMLSLVFFNMAAESHDEH